jgi:DNA-binding response OmpR family regulator
MNARVLIAHGNALMTDVLREVLEREGCEVTTTPDGHGALGRALCDGYQLLLIDRDLPGMGGERVLEELQARGTHIPALITCSDRSWKSLAPGVLGVLPLPFEEALLLEAVEAALEGDRVRIEQASVLDPAPTQPLVPGSRSLRRKHALRPKIGLPDTDRVAPPPAAVPSRKRVLLIEADPGILERHRRVLVAAGYEVIPVRRGDEGFELGMIGTFDLIVTDLWLPGLDGFELISGLKGGGTTAPVVVATAYLRKDMVAELRGLGVRRVLIKPFPEAALVRCALSTVRP